MAKPEDLAATRFELIRLGFTLAAFRAHQGAYPAKLADLVPKYVAEVPKDLFSGKELRYKREAGGYLLYSVGVNGKDEGGKTQDDDISGQQGWDDLAIRVPARVEKKKVE